MLRPWQLSYGRCRFGWREDDARLPLLLGAPGGLQLAAAADWPLLGTGPVRVVPMLTLTVLQAGKGLRLEILPSCVIRSARANGGPW